MILPVEKLLEDGSYLSSFYSSTKARRHRREALVVRVIEYQLEQQAQPNPTLYRLISTILDSQQASAQQLAELYHQRWEIEGLFDELKTHLRGGRIVLRSKQPELVKQEFYGLVLAHWMVRSLIYEAAQGEKLDPDRVSFTHSLRIVRRKLAAWPAVPPSAS